MLNTPRVNLLCFSRAICHPPIDANWRQYTTGSQQNRKKNPKFQVILQYIKKKSLTMLRSEAISKHWVKKLMARPFVLGRSKYFKPD